MELLLLVGYMLLTILGFVFTFIFARMKRYWNMVTGILIIPTGIGFTYSFLRDMNRIDFTPGIRDTLDSLYNTLEPVVSIFWGNLFDKLSDVNYGLYPLLAIFVIHIILYIRNIIKLKRTPISPSDTENKPQQSTNSTFFKPVSESTIKEQLFVEKSSLIVHLGLIVFVSKSLWF